MPAVGRDIPPREVPHAGTVFLACRRLRMSIVIDETSSFHELQLRLSRAEARVAEALTGRAAADARTQHALTLFAAVSWVWEARTTEDLYGALDEVASAVLRRRIAVYVLERGCARLRVAHTNVSGAPVAASAVLGEGVIGRAAAERRTITGFVPGTSEPVVAVPLGARPHLMGSLLVYASPSGTSLDSDQLQFLEIVGRHAGNALSVLSPVASVL
jgi:hypothetical protein